MDILLTLHSFLPLLIAAVAVLAIGLQGLVLSGRCFVLFVEADGPGLLSGCGGAAAAAATAAHAHAAHAGAHLFLFRAARREPL